MARRDDFLAELEIYRPICYHVGMTNEQRLSVLYDYAAGRLGTRSTIERLGLDDYADLIIALSAHDLALPKPPETPTLDAHRERARALLLPRLKHGA